MADSRKLTESEVIRLLYLVAYGEGKLDEFGGVANGCNCVVCTRLRSNLLNYWVYGSLLEPTYGP